MEIIESKKFDLIASLVEEVQNLHADLFPSIYKPFQLETIREMMEQLLADEKCKVFIAREEGNTRGYIMVLIKDIPENAFHHAYKLLHIDQIAVSGNYQKAGVGSILMDKSEELAKELGINRIELDHLFVNDTAAKFFKGKGFSPYRAKLSKTLGSK